MLVSEMEPNLSAPIADGYTSTWGDKKRLCELEAESTVEYGLGADTNPYEVNSWPWKWWNEHFLALTLVDIIH
ncbi:MAG: hypothetical protein Q7K26_00600 [bacterium]|nr:hypothetical protein [bacterium]